MTMTRRGFLSASAAFAATPALQARAWAAPVPPRDADIVVIGAGAAGIAAIRLFQSAPDLPSLVSSLRNSTR